MGLRFHSGEHPLVLHKANEIFLSSDQTELIIQNALLQKENLKPYAENISVISSDEECVIIQITSNYEQNIFPDRLLDEVGKIIRNLYGWDSVIILTTNKTYEAGD